MCVCVCVFRLHKMSLRILFILLTLTMTRMWSMPNWMPSNLSNICEIRLINGQLEADDANEAKRCTHSHTHTNSLAQTLTLSLTPAPHSHSLLDVTDDSSVGPSSTNPLSCCSCAVSFVLYLFQFIFEGI